MSETDESMVESNWSETSAAGARGNQLPVVMAVIEADASLEAMEANQPDSVEVEVNGWLLRASDQVIASLVNEGGGPGFASDEIARDFDLVNPEVDQIMDFVGRSSGGFSVTVEMSGIADLMILSDRVDELSCRDELLESASEDVRDWYGARQSEAALLSASPEVRLDASSKVGL